MAYVLARETADGSRRWTAYYRDDLGKRHSCGTFDSRTEALARATEAESRGAVGHYDRLMSFESFVSVWLPTSELSPLTKKNYRSVLNNHVVPSFLGKRRVSEITEQDIRVLNSNLQRAGVSSTMRARVRSAIGSAFREMVEHGVVTSNPTHRLGIKASPTRRGLNVLEPDEYKLIRQQLPNPSAQLFADFLVTSGCRFGEVTELRVKDINIPTREVFVERRVIDLGAVDNEGKRFLVLEGTKGGNARGVVLSAGLIAELESHIKSHNLGRYDLLFPKALVIGETVTAKLEQKKHLVYAHGTRTAYTRGGCRCEECRRANRDYRRVQRGMKTAPVLVRTKNESGHLPRDQWRRIWMKAIKLADIGWNPRTHDLRHANATQLLKNGVDLHEVKERLGHASIQTTERYLHRVRHLQSNAGEAVADFLEVL
jgi:integrase